MSLLKYTTYILIAVSILVNSYHSSAHYCESLHSQGRVYSKFVMKNCQATFDRLTREDIQSISR